MLSQIVCACIVGASFAILGLVACVAASLSVHVHPRHHHSAVVPVLLAVAVGDTFGYES